MNKELAIAVTSLTQWLKQTNPDSMAQAVGSQNRIWKIQAGYCACRCA